MKVCRRFVSNSILFACLIGSFVAFGGITARAAQASRLEELFIWKASEELKLPTEQETKFAEIIRDLNTRRKAANEKMDLAVKAMGSVKNKSDAEKALQLHRSSLKDFQSLQMAELDRLKALFGSEKLARYLVIKNELSEKLRVMLSAPAENASKSGHLIGKPDVTPVAPKVIEEK